MRAEIDVGSALAHLSTVDGVMAGIIATQPAFELLPAFEDPFLALTRAIVFQQLSGKAASTIFGRFLDLARDERLTTLDPAKVLGLADEAMRAAGLSRQKIAAVRDLAGHFARGALSTDLFDQWENEEIITHLVAVRGVGRWTAEMYLMFQLGRPDVLPVNDVGVNRAIMKLYGLEAMPKPDEVRRVGPPWSPWASVACWYLWRTQDVVPV